MNQIEDNFRLNDNGLFECLGCGTTFESELECSKHLDNLEEESI